MTRRVESPFDALEKVFHEPNRLAIMSALCAADDELSFSDLKTACKLTDGNLNRHLKVLEEAGVVKVRKAFVRGKPRTTLSLSRKGLTRFTEYLGALGHVLEQAQRAVTAESRAVDVPFGRTAPA
jgi:DNA-binding transcriptional ArsR family regulator